MARRTRYADRPAGLGSGSCRCGGRFDGRSGFGTARLAAIPELRPRLFFSGHEQSVAGRALLRALGLQIRLSPATEVLGHPLSYPPTVLGQAHGDFIGDRAGNHLIGKHAHRAQASPWRKEGREEARRRELAFGLRIFHRQGPGSPVAPAAPSKPTPDSARPSRLSARFTHEADAGWDSWHLPAHLIAIPHVVTLGRGASPLTEPRRLMLGRKAWETAKGIARNAHRMSTDVRASGVSIDAPNATIFNAVPFCRTSKRISHIGTFEVIQHRDGGRQTKRHTRQFFERFLVGWRLKDTRERTSIE